MNSVRRLYLYGVSAVALTLLCLGATDLLQLIAGTLAETLTGTPVVGGANREQLALSIALLLVGLPLWLVHWWLVERSVRRPTPAGDAERRSDLRGFYLAMVAAVSLGWLAQQSATALESALRSPFITNDYGSEPIAYNLAAALVALVAWVFHVGTRHRDTLAGPLADAAAWWSRLYLYGAMVAGALVALRGVASVIETVGNALLGTGPLLGGMLAPQLASAVGLSVVGGVIYTTHAVYARRLTEAPDWRRAAERASRVRGGHDVVAAALMVPLFLYAAADGLRWLLAIPLDIDQPADLAVQVQRIVGPVVTMLPFAIGAWLCGRQSVIDAGRYVGSDAAIDTRRAARLVVAAIGLTFTAVGAARTLGLVLEQIFGPASIGSDIVARGDIAMFAAMTLVGLPVWLIAWAGVERSGARDRAAESRSTARRAYLYFVMGASVIAAGITLAFTAYQVIRWMLGVSTEGGAWQLSQPIAIAIVGGLLLAYHLWVLRSDVAVRSTLESEAPEAAVAETGPMVIPAAVAGTLAHEELVLEGPPGADFEPVNEVLRDNLPLGWSLRVVGAGGSTGAS